MDVTQYPITGSAAVLALMEYTYFGLRVGRQRYISQIEAPKVTGDETFERVYRVQMNTLENIAIFLPALLVHLHSFKNDKLTGSVGLVWVLGRALFAKGYYTDAKKRGPGFAISFLAQAFLLGSIFYKSGQTLVNKYKK